VIFRMQAEYLDAFGTGLTAHGRTLNPSANPHAGGLRSAEW
jgi:hypothetical protein